MIRALVHGLVILHLGPGIAFALLAFGCDGPQPALGAICGQAVFASFAKLTAGSWVILGLGLVSMLLVLRTRAAGAPSSLRAWALLSVLAAGVAIGASGAGLTGSDWWWLAIPVLLTAAWLRVADPTRCEPNVLEP